MQADSLRLKGCIEKRNPCLVFPSERNLLQLQGFGDPIKKTSLKSIVGTLDQDIIFLQETVGDCISIKETLESLLVDWFFVAVDARGRSGGLATRWK